MLSAHTTWRNPRIITLLLLIFLAGGLVGAMVMRQVHRRAHERLGYQVTDSAMLSYDQLKDELNLTPDQAQKLKTMLDDFVRYNQDLQMQIEDYRATGKNRIRSILNPQQQQRFEKLCAELQNH